jgi:hypothetical protein
LIARPLNEISAISEVAQSRIRRNGCKPVFTEQMLLLANKLSRPSVNVLNNLQHVGLSMLQSQILLHPCYKMVLECAFNKLMEEVRHDQFMNVSTQKSVHKWLRKEYDLVSWGSGNE